MKHTRYLIGLLFAIVFVLAAGETALAYNRDTVPVQAAGINLNLNQAPKEFRISKAAFKSQSKRDTAYAKARTAYESWENTWKYFRQNGGEPDYSKGEVYSTLAETEAKFEISVMGYYVQFHLAHIYSAYTDYSTMRKSEDYYLYLQALYCFISTNNVCFKGGVTGKESSVKKAKFSGTKVYESFYSADYKRLDNLHGPHSQPILWFNDRGVEKRAATWAAKNHSKGKITSDFLPETGKVSVKTRGSVSGIKSKLKKVGISSLPVCMRIRPKLIKNDPEMSKKYIDLSDNLKSQHSNFENGTTAADRAYTELLEAATQVFQYLGEMSKTCRTVKEFKNHSKYTLYLQAVKCFISINKKCFGNSFAKGLTINDNAVVTKNIFAQSVDKVKKKVKCRKASALKQAYYLSDYTTKL